MDWDFTANTPEELSKIGKALLHATKRKYLDEQVQMTRLLEALSQQSILQFPVRARHRGEVGSPDYQLETGGRRIGIELSKVTVQDVECARHLQQKYRKQTLSISSLYKKQPKPRTEDQVIAEGFSMPAIWTPLSVNELDTIWLEAVTSELEDKTKVFLGGHFDHGNEDWLALWDRIGTGEDEVGLRIQSLSNILAPRWSPDWYSRVFLQDENFRWLVMFSKSEQVFLEMRS